MNGQTIKICLIGCGDHAMRYHAAPLAHYAAEHPGEITLAGACDIDIARAKEIASRFGFSHAYTDWQRMVDTEHPDTCLAIVPAQITADIGAQLLERGIPTVLEKPLGVAMADARRLAEIAHRTGTKHMVSMNRRFIPALNRALTWVAGRAPIRFVRCTMLRNKRTEPDFIWSTGVHAIDAMRYIAGDVAAHTVSTRAVGNPPVLWHFITFDFANGCFGEFHSAPTAGTSKESYEIFGENYLAEVEIFVPNKPPTIRCWRDGKLILEETSPADEPDYIARGEYAETSAWILALRNTQPAAPTISAVLQSMELGFEIARTSLNGGKSAS